MSAMQIGMIMLWQLHIVQLFLQLQTTYLWRESASPALIPSIARSASMATYVLPNSAEAHEYLGHGSWQACSASIPAPVWTADGAQLIAISDCPCNCLSHFSLPPGPSTAANSVRQHHTDKQDQFFIDAGSRSTNSRGLLPMMLVWHADKSGHVQRQRWARTWSRTRPLLQTAWSTRRVLPNTALLQWRVPLLVALQLASLFLLTSAGAMLWPLLRCVILASVRLCARMCNLPISPCVGGSGSKAATALRPAPWSLGHGEAPSLAGQYQAGLDGACGCFHDKPDWQLFVIHPP